VSVIETYHLTLLILACGLGLFMAFGIGANDVANAMGTSVGAKALTIKQAILVAIVFEFAGAYLAGGEVTATIRKGIIDTSAIADTPELLVFGMLSALAAAGTWLLFASFAGWPVSTTHSIVGAIVGFAIAGIGVEAVQWGKVGKIVMSWVVSPVLAGTISYLVFQSVQKLILNAEDPFHNAKRYVPFYMFAVGAIMGMVTLLKGLKHVFRDAAVSISFAENVALAGLFGLVVMLIGIFLLRRVKVDPAADEAFRYASVERVFAILMVFTACAMAFAHGSNDVANAVGPLAAIIGVLNTGSIAAKSVMPSWILLLGGLGIVVGLAVLGYKVMGTIGKKITELTPSRGFAAELGAATTVVIASGTGLPISTTHTLVGAVLGVGLARGMSSLNLAVVGQILSSWLITLPAGALLSILFFFIFRTIFAV
jgi:PiT family inorganic phosphate transporter